MLVENKQKRHIRITRACMISLTQSIRHVPKSKVNEGKTQFSPLILFVVGVKYKTYRYVRRMYYN